MSDAPPPLPEPTLVESAPSVQARERAGARIIAALALGYVGIYLCRKNLSVAVPLLQQAFGATKAQVGIIASTSTLAYAAGKVVTGPIIDRIGGRRGFLLALVTVALFGALGAFAPGLLVLTILYSANRFAGSAGWGAMLKLVPTWFGPSRTGTAVGALSLSYVGGGICATLLAREILAFGGGWRAVMGVPSAFLIAIFALCAFTVRAGPLHAASAPDTGAPAAEERAQRAADLLVLVRRPQFLITCALSFTLTLMRESFNTWSVDFLTSVQGGHPSVATAALQSTGFDLAGFVSIFFAGVAYDRTPPAHRRFLMAGSLGLLSIVVAVLYRTALFSPVGGAILVGLAGLLVYGPYSLLAGALAVESGGAKLAATAAGIIDGVGYVAGALAGVTLGKLLDVGGYGLGFGVLAGVTAVAALISLTMRPAARAA